MNNNILNFNDWTFDNIDFDAHVRTQLPWYEMCSKAVAYIAKNYIPSEGGVLYDIGASNGNITNLLRDTLSQRKCNAVSIDNCSTMNFAGYGDFVVTDATEFNYRKFDVCILFLTLMFIPVSKRSDFINGLVANMKDGAVIIIVDKVENNYGYLSTVFKRLTMEFKKEFCTVEQIVEKESSLIGVQRPSTNTGKTFFKMGEFEGWVIEK